MQHEPATEPGYSEGGQPWDGAEGGRRDWEPHHGRELRLLSVVGLACSVESFAALAYPPWSFAAASFGLGGFLLGLLTAGLAAVELSHVHQGFLDPDGEGPLRSARRWGAGAVYISLFSGLFTLLAVAKALHLL